MAADAATGLSGTEASAAIDAVLCALAARRAEGGWTPADGGSVHLHCTDVVGEWTVRPNVSGGWDVAREHAKGDAAVRGAAAQILAVLLGHATLDSVDVLGERTAAEHLLTQTSGRT